MEDCQLVKLHKSIRQVAKTAVGTHGSACKWISRNKTTQGVAPLKPTDIWCYVGRKVDAVGCKTSLESKAAVLSQIKNVIQRVMNNPYRSMAQCITHVWETKGEKPRIELSA